MDPCLIHDLVSLWVTIRSQEVVEDLSDPLDHLWLLHPDGDLALDIFVVEVLVDILVIIDIFLSEHPHLLLSELPLNRLISRVLIHFMHSIGSWIIPTHLLESINLL